jgi:hypothetical protein
MSTFTVIETISVLQCAECAISFGVPQRFEKDRRNDHVRFYCPRGHVNIFREENAEEILRRERDRARQQLACVEDEKREALRQAERAKEETRKLKKRAAAGTCPCCARSFSNMTEHMKKQHPQFVASNVVTLKKKA